MKDVAEMAGVSLITVSRVLNAPELVKDETKARVEEAIKELKFVPNYTAKALAENKTRVIYLYIPKESSLDELVNMNLISGIMSLLSEKQYSLQITRNFELPQKCDGMIVIGVNGEEKDIDSKIRVPYVSFGRVNSSIDYVDIDNYKGSYDMTKYLISKGHKDIMFLRVKDKNKGFNERFKGYRDALLDSNIEYKESLVIDIDENKEQLAYLAMRYTEKVEKATALFCSTDLTAVGACRALREKNILVPKDLSVVGFDGLANEIIPLTTVKQPVYKVGERLAEMLISRINNRAKEIEKVLIKPEIIISQSTAYNSLVEDDLNLAL
ncbi:MAG: LacI family DNA-binding transcriptional regulator [Clostridium perfringens]|nr:LacI family DNA-binding transcriptional regulator [Clostridium perfringens]